MSLLVLLVSPYTIWYDTGKNNEGHQKIEVFCTKTVKAEHFACN